MSEKNSLTIKLDKNSELRRARRTKLLFVCLLFILLILGGIVGFLRKKEFQISEVTITGTKSLDPETVLKVAHHYLNGHYVIIIPKTNTLLLSKSDLVDFVTDELPSLEKASVAFKGKNSIEITIAEKKPSYVWCDDSCYFVDDTGMIYEESPKFTQGVFVTFSGGIQVSDQQNPIKTHFVSEDRFEEIIKVLTALDQLSVHVIAVNFGEDITLQVDAIKKSSLGSESKILIKPDESVQDIFNSLTLLMSDKTFSNTLAAKGSQLQYIDIRFPEKIYYKFDTPVAEVTQQPTTANAKLLEKTQ